MILAQRNTVKFISIFRRFRKPSTSDQDLHHPNGRPAACRLFLVLFFLSFHNLESCKTLSWGIQSCDSGCSVQKIQNQGITILGDLVLKDKSFVYDLVGQRIDGQTTTVKISTL